MKNLLILSVVFLSACAIPKSKTPIDVALWSRCDPAHISYWVGQHDYKVVKGWNNAEECMAMPAFDCKCSATIAADTLLACGYEARIQVIKHNKSVHAVTLYTNKDTGARGFINGQFHKEYGKETPWPHVIDGISGGPWTAQ